MENLNQEGLTIYRDNKGKFTVLVDGKAIPNLRSFSITVTNEHIQNGITAAPFYRVEQFLPKRRAKD